MSALVWVRELNSSDEVIGESPDFWEVRSRQKQSQEVSISMTD